MTINLSPQEASIFNAAWTLIEKMDDCIKVALYLQLGKSNKVIESNRGQQENDTRGSSETC